MSRFNFSFFALVFACLFTVSCEKEELVINSPAPANKLEAEYALQHAVPTISGHIEERAVAVLAKLSVEPVFAAENIKLTVATEAPTNAKFRYLDVLPDRSAPAAMSSNEVAELDIDCPYGDCETTIPAMAARYQEIATAQCNDQYLCITCCADGGTVYVMIYIEAECMPASLR